MVCGIGFREWLFQEERRGIDPAVLQSYENAFQQGLRTLIARTKDPELRQAFADMQACPVRGQDGRCHRFIDYILGALIRWTTGNRTIDLEDALQMIVFHMLSPVGERGQRRKSLFDFDESRPYDLRIGNPLQQIFRVYLANDLRSIVGNKIARLRTIHRPKGTISIGSGGNDDPGTAKPDEIPGRAAENDEIMADIMELLEKKSTPDLPLCNLFADILAGSGGTRQQRHKYGHGRCDLMRKIIIKTVEDYAYRTENWQLLRLLDRIRNPEPAAPRPPKAPANPKLPPDEQDFRSIIDVMEKHGRRVGSAILGKARRRWLERKPRNPSSPYANRLADVLANMTAAGVIDRRGLQYVPGPRYQQFLPDAVLVSGD